MGLLLMTKRKKIFFSCISIRNSKLRVLKEDQKIVYDIKEEKINFKLLILKEIIYRGVEQSGSSSGS